MTDFATRWDDLLAATVDIDAADALVDAAHDMRQSRERAEKQVRALLEKTVAANATARRIHDAAQRRRAELDEAPDAPTLAVAPPDIPEGYGEVADPHDTTLEIIT